MKSACTNIHTLYLIIIQLPYSNVFLINVVVVVVVTVVEMHRTEKKILVAALLKTFQQTISPKLKKQKSDLPPPAAK